MLGNLFEARKDWLLPPNYTDDDTKSAANATSTKPPIKVEPKPEGQPATSLKAKKCGWGAICLFCKNQEEDWNGDHKKQIQQQPQPQQKTQVTQVQCPQTMSYPNPRVLRRSTQRHLVLLVSTKLSQNSINNGKRKWRDSILSTI